METDFMLHHLRAAGTRSGRPVSASIVAVVLVLAGGLAVAAGGWVLLMLTDLDGGVNPAVGLFVLLLAVVPFVGAWQLWAGVRPPWLLVLLVGVTIVTSTYAAWILFGLSITVADSPGVLELPATPNLLVFGLAVALAVVVAAVAGRRGVPPARTVSGVVLVVSVTAFVLPPILWPVDSFWGRGDGNSWPLVDVLQARLVPMVLWSTVAVASHRPVWLAWLSRRPAAGRRAERGSGAWEAPYYDPG